MIEIKKKKKKSWLLFKKNTVLVWDRLRIIGSMLGSRGVSSLQSFSNAKRAFVNEARIFYLFILCFVLPTVFISPLLAYILSFYIPFLSVEGCRTTAESSKFTF